METTVDNFVPLHEPFAFELPLIEPSAHVVTEQRTGAPQPAEEPHDDCEPDALDLLAVDDDSQWDVFLPDDEIDPLPDPGDFWLDQR